MAAERGVESTTELAPGLTVADLPTALAAVRHVNRPDFRLLIDTMHLVRSEGIDVLTLCPGATESEAAGLQGIDIKTVHNVMPADEVARLTLDNIQNGPTFFSSDFYKGDFDKLLALPRRDALMAMAQGMKR